jgi:hypothetical protein
MLWQFPQAKTGYNLTFHAQWHLKYFQKTLFASRQEKLIDFDQLREMHILTILKNPHSIWLANM